MRKDPLLGKGLIFRKELFLGNRTRSEIEESRMGCGCQDTNGWALKEDGSVGPCPIEGHAPDHPEKPDERTEVILREVLRKCPTCGGGITRLNYRDHNSLVSLCKHGGAV